MNRCEVVQFEMDKIPQAFHARRPRSNRAVTADLVFWPDLALWRTLAHPGLPFYVVFGCVEVLTFMQGETAERWRMLCAQAALEQDVDKLIELTQEICRLLQEKEQRLRHRQSPESADAVA